MLVSLAPDVPLCEITSGTFSPTLKKGIGMALVPTFVDPEAELGVQIRTRREIFGSTKLPVRRHLGARESMNLPEQPATFRQPPPAERPWWWKLHDGSGGEARVPEEYSDQRFASQADAESWVGEVWAELGRGGRRRGDAAASTTARSTARCRSRPEPAGWSAEWTSRCVAASVEATWLHATRRRQRRRCAGRSGRRATSARSG